MVLNMLFFEVGEVVVACRSCCSPEKLDTTGGKGCGEGWHRAHLHVLVASVDVGKDAARMSACSEGYTTCRRTACFRPLLANFVSAHSSHLVTANLDRSPVASRLFIEHVKSR